VSCDISAYAERRAAGVWHATQTFCNLQNYALFGFLANVRNYSAIPTLVPPRGLPNDVSTVVAEHFGNHAGDAHSASWFTLDELTAFDYDAPVEDRRYTKQVGPNSWNGGATCEPGSGEMTTYRKLFNQRFFSDLDAMRNAGAERIVFWFRG